MNPLESDIQKQITTYLEIERQAGRITWNRLNSGSRLVRGSGRYNKIVMCRPGTADLIVHKGFTFIDNSHFRDVYKPSNKACRTIYLEVKRPGERQNDDQLQFQAEVEAQGAEYHVVHDADEVQDILK